MIILGIDPGSQITGFGVIKKNQNKITHIDNGAIHCGKEKLFHKRLVIIFEKIQELINQFKPEVVAVENIFYSKNVKSTVKLGHARGAALVACSLSQLPIFEYTPLEIKQAIVGYGVATKDQTQKMVKALLNLPEVAEENASDALAVAICYAHSEGLNKALAKAR